MFDVHQLKDGERALRVGQLAVALVLAVGPGADVLVEALGRAQAGVESGETRVD